MLLCRQFKQLGYQYNKEEETACREYLNIVNKLPKDAQEIK